MQPWQVKKKMEEIDSIIYKLRSNIMRKYVEVSRNEVNFFGFDSQSWRVSGTVIQEAHPRPVVIRVNISLMGPNYGHMVCVTPKSLIEEVKEVMAERKYSFVGAEGKEGRSFLFSAL
jgi:hypothetical protein